MENLSPGRTSLKKPRNGGLGLGPGSRGPHGIEILFIDPHKGIQDDENNVCL